MSYALEAESLQVSLIDQRVLIRDFNLKLRFGELLVVTGPNGAGKSTLAHTIIGLHKLYHGTLSRNFKYSGFLPQLANREFLLPLTLFDILQIEHSKVEVDDVLQMGFFARKADLDVAWNSASGGERQRALLTCLLLRDSDFLILDEPFNHLDQKAQSRLEAILAEKKKKGCAIVLISHDQNCLRLADQVIQIPGGE